MKILYLSVHEILEFDEVTLLNELGHEVFSPGSFVSLLNRGDQCLRPDISSFTYNPDIVEQWHNLCAQFPGEDGKDHLTKEFVDNFQMVIVMHLPRFIINNWKAIKHKRVIWRTIGQSISETEQEVKFARDQGMEIVRYSPMEASGIPGFIGQDAMIRFYKDPDEFKGWTGRNQEVVTFSQDMVNRSDACNFRLFELTTRPFRRSLFGINSEKLSFGKGKVSFEVLKEQMRLCRAYFYTGTHPASYTLNFIEALMTGAPIVAIGSGFGNAPVFQNHILYEIPHIIQNYYNGFVSDNIDELMSFIKVLLDNKAVADAISLNGRQKAIELFGKPTIKQQWKDYLGE